MTKRVQLIRHAAEVANQFLGLLGELTADYDNAELRLHDGSTEGGARFLNRDANDERYQARSLELDGLLGWEPNERGMVTRLGTSTYRLRQLLTVAGQLVVTNPDGYSGNPILGLASTITTDHTFSGEVSFTQPIIATGGVVGNLVGNVVGNLLGNVVGNVNGNLTGNATGSHSGSFAGNVDVRGKTLRLDAGQLDLDWLSQEIIDFIIRSGVPIGTVVAFSGLLINIPDGWFVCDGNNGTPDLRDRFIMGVASGSTASFGDTGGSATHSHTVTIDSGGAHTHTGTVGGTSLTTAQLPAHKHANGVTDQNTNLVFSRGHTAAATTTPKCIDDNGASGIYEGWTSDVGSGDAHSHPLTVDSGGAHAHSGSTAATSSHPPYYALYYIMKGA